MLSSDTRLVRVMDRLVDMLHKNHDLSTDLSHENPEHTLTLDQFKIDINELCKEISKGIENAAAVNDEHKIEYVNEVNNETGNFQGCDSLIIHRRIFNPPNQESFIGYVLQNTYAYVQIAFNEHSQELGIRTETYSGNYLVPTHTIRGNFEVIKINANPKTALEQIHEKVYQSLHFRGVFYRGP